MEENNADISRISEIKLVGSFPSGQLKTCRFSMPYRYDRNSMGGEILLYIRDDTPTKLLKHNFGNNIESLSIEMVFQWLLQSAKKKNFESPKLLKSCL